jgi:hypothetical protein
LNGLSWNWIALMLIGPLPLGVLAATPVWRRGETVLGNIAGAAVIFAIAFGLIFRESAALDVARQACFDAGFPVCAPSPAAFARYAIYAAIGMFHVVVVFAISLKVEERRRERDYAPEWRR